MFEPTQVNAKTLKKSIKQVSISHHEIIGDAVSEVFDHKHMKIYLNFVFKMIHNNCIIMVCCVSMLGSGNDCLFGEIKENFLER